MGMIDFVHAVASRFVRWIATVRRGADFTCGDCPRADQCGDPPSDTCVVRAAEMARDDWKDRRRARRLSYWTG